MMLFIRLPFAWVNGLKDRIACLNRFTNTINSCHCTLFGPEALYASAHKGHAVQLSWTGAPALRGRISVLNRQGLEKRTCECYAVVKMKYDRLLPGKSVT